MLETINLGYTYNDKSPFARTIFTDINLKVLKKEKVLLIAPSGSGKTTLMNLVAKLKKPTTGTIKYQNQDIWKQKNYAQQVGYLIQNSSKQISCRTLYQEINLGYKALYQENVANDKINFWLKKFDLDKGLKDNPLTFSSGEKKLISIISFLICDYQLLILDEPLINLDRKHQKILLDLISEPSLTVIVITHNINNIYQKFDQVIYLNQNQEFIKTPIKEFLKINKELDLIKSPDQIVLEDYAKKI